MSGILGLVLVARLRSLSLLKGEGLLLGVSILWVRENLYLSFRLGPGLGGSGYLVGIVVLCGRNLVLTEGVLLGLGVSGRVVGFAGRGLLAVGLLVIGIVVIIISLTHLYLY